MTTVMWEVKAADGSDAALLAWVLERAAATADVYRSSDGRVVVIDPTGTGLPEPPAELVARAPHAWRFRRIER
jgi:hypothetical protein